MERHRIHELVFKVSFSIVFTEFLLAVAAGAVYLIVKWHSRPTRDPRALSTIYSGKSWAQKYWQEFKRTGKVEYRPYVGWGMVPFHGETIATDQEGFRRSFSSKCDDGTSTVWMFGGSTLWGEGLPDWLTIPSQLAREYSNAGKPICVRNFGVRAWVSTQEVVELMLELKRAPRKPDLVIFYDGINDVFSFYQSGKIDVHQDFDHVQDIFDHGGRLSEILANRLSLIPHLWKPEHGRVRLITDEEAQTELDAAYIKNMRVVEALALQYGFNYTFFLQPVILASHKALTAEEEALQKDCLQKFPGLDLFYFKIYDLARAEARRHFFDFSDTLDGQKGTVYIDFAHISPEGNHMIAARMFQMLHAQGL